MKKLNLSLSLFFWLSLALSISPSLFLPPLCVSPWLGAGQNNDTVIAAKEISQKPALTH